MTNAVTARNRDDIPGRETVFAAALTALAAAFQLQITAPFSTVGIRVSAADVVIPIFGATLSFMMLSGRIPFPRWRLPHLWVWFGTLSLWLAIALLIGRIYSGQWIAWALVNKFAGWFVLLANFVVAGQIAAADPSGRWRRIFLKALFLSTWILAAGTIFLFALARIGIPVFLPGSDAMWRLEGAFVNANAYGYFIAVMIALQAPYLARRSLISLRFHRIGLVIGFVALILAASRSAWIGCALAMPVLWKAGSLDLRETIRAATIGILLAIVIYLLPTIVQGLLSLIPAGVGPAWHGAGLFGTPAELFGTPAAQVYFVQERGADIDQRLHVLSEAFSAWLAHPIEGIGLGGFFWQRVVAGDSPLILIHSSAQWLLTETGLIGLGLFLGFFAAILRTLLVPSAVPEENSFRIAALAALAVFVGASIGMEAIYQRHLWFILGWALAAPPISATVVAAKGAAAPS